MRLVEGRAEPRMNVWLSVQRENWTVEVELKCFFLSSVGGGHSSYSSGIQEGKNK